MPRTFVDISNAALTRIGLPLISSFTDGTIEANACNLRWEEDRDIVLRMHPWTCATKRAVLSPSATKPAFEYLYAFPLPDDFLRVAPDGVSDSGIASPEDFLGPRPDYRIESGNILYGNANYAASGVTSALYLVYIAQVTDASQLDPECANAMAIYMAYDLAQLLQQSQSLVKQLSSEFEAALATARNVNAQEQQTCTVIDTFERWRIWGPG
jgi:hypothetical protein